MDFFGEISFTSKFLEPKITNKSEKYSLICPLFFLREVGEEERNSLEASSWEVRLQINMDLNGFGSKIQFDLSSWKAGVNESLIQGLMGEICV